jgi:hypothetical protein
MLFKRGVADIRKGKGGIGVQSEPIGEMEKNVRPLQEPSE